MQRLFFMGEDDSLLFGGWTFILKEVAMDRQLIDLRDGHRYKMDELRGRIRGMLQGQLTRHIQTALDASRLDPPYTAAIQERLEDALRLIKKELGCL